MSRQNKMEMDLMNLDLKTDHTMKSSLLRFRTMKALLSLLMIIGLFCYLIVSPVAGQDQPNTDLTDLSNESWEDEPTAEEEKSGGLSGMNWEDEEGEGAETKEDDSFMTMTEEEEIALESRERRIHFFGFFLFIGYILGGILTGFFTRNRKLAVDYPPELLILLHSVWPLEWLFLTFAGKKVR